MKTVLGDTLEDFLKIGNKLYPKSFNNNHELLRCENHKKIESEYLLKMPINSSFLDIGANYGDTVLTMSLHAKKNNRLDIRFFAFEPNKKKCKFIKRVAKRNDLKIKIYNCCVGNLKGHAVCDRVKNIDKGFCSFKYSDNKNDIEIMRMDDIQDIIKPIGLMHVDTEGWELEVLKGSHNILSKTDNSFILICECWISSIAEKQIRKGRTNGIMSSNPKKDIISIISKYNYEKLEDINDEELNLVFKIKN